MRGKGKSGATTAAKENAVNTVAKKAESTIEAVAEKAKEAVKKVEVKEEAVKETLAETKAEVKAEVKAVEKAVEKESEPAAAVTERQLQRVSRLRKYLSSIMASRLMKRHYLKELCRTAVRIRFQWKI
mgnify:CR=1 FL=1